VESISNFTTHTKASLKRFIHAGAANDARVELVWIDAEEVEKHGVEKYMKGISGLLVAPGFGSRGIEGKIRAIKYVREKKIPFFGICLGMQCAVIESARKRRQTAGCKLHGVSASYKNKMSST